MKKTCCVTVTFLLMMRLCVAQPNNSVYGEFLGAGDLYSINYERMFQPNQSIRIGFGMFPENWFEGGVSEKQLINIPLSYQYLIGKTNHKLETAAGMVTSLTISKNQPTQYLLSPNISAGYRYQRSPRGPYIGIKMYLFMPWFVSVDQSEWLFYRGKSYYFSPGFSIGWSF